MIIIQLITLYLVSTLCQIDDQTCFINDTSISHDILNLQCQNYTVIHIENSIIECNQKFQINQKTVINISHTQINCLEVEIQNKSTQLFIHNVTFGQYQSNQTIYNMILNKDYRIIYFNVREVNITGSLYSLYFQQKLIIQADKFNFQSPNTSMIKADVIGFLSTSTIKIVNFTIESVRFFCNHAKDKKFFSLLDYKYNHENQSQSYLNKTFSYEASLFLQNLTNYSFSLVIISSQSIDIDNTQLIGSRIGIYGEDLTVKNDSIISSSGKGCPLNEIKYQQGGGFYFEMVKYDNLTCRPAAGSGQGYGGVGFPLNKSDEKMRNCQILHKQIKYQINSFPQNALTFLDGTKGFHLNDSQQYESVNGGGVINIQIKNNLTLQGKIQANGNSEIKTQDEIQSQGSGGSIYVQADQIIGNGSLQANGGNSSSEENGEGGGGLIEIIYFNWHNMKGNNFKGRIQAKKGTRELADKYVQDWAGTDGYVSLSACIQGFQFNSTNLECEPCPENFYKKSLVGGCKKCISEIYFANMFPDKIGVEGCKQNTIQRVILSCDLIWLQFEALSGFYGMFCFFLIIFIINTGQCIRRLKRKKQIKINEIQDIQPDYINHHVHRIVVLGSNSPLNKWVLPVQLPQEIDYLVNKEEFWLFADQFNKMVNWNKKDVIFSMLLGFIYPLKNVFENYIKKRNLRRAQKFLASYSWQCLYKVPTDPNFELKNYILNERITIKPYFSNDLNHFYLDIFNQSRDNYEHNSNIFYFQGDGSFFYPYQLDTNDHSYKGFKAENLENFDKYEKKLNRLLLTLDWSSFSKTFCLNLYGIIEFIQNTQYHQISIDLVIIKRSKYEKKQMEQDIKIIINKNQEGLQALVNDLYEINMQNQHEFSILFGLYIFCQNKEEPKDVQHLQAYQIKIKDTTEINFQEESQSNMSSPQFQQEFGIKTKRLNKIKLNYIYKDTSNLYKLVNYTHSAFNTLRYVGLSHKTASWDHNIMILIFFILCFLDSFITIVLMYSDIQSIFYSDIDIWQIYIFIPFPFSIMLSPIFSSIYISCQTYSVLRIYLIVNYLSFWNLVLNIFVAIFFDELETMQCGRLNTFLMNIAAIGVKVIISQWGAKILSRSWKTKN